MATASSDDPGPETPAEGPSRPVLPGDEPALDPTSLAAEFPELSEFEALGRGGFASVFSARHPHLGVVALKVLTGTPEWRSDETGRRTFWNRVATETQAIGSLSADPSIVTLHTSGTSRSGWPYLLMELCPGGSLRELLRRRERMGDGPLPARDVAVVGIALSSALAAAHRRGILHLDVKPANVLVNRFGAFQLSDFGIARSINDAPPDADESFLTPHYAPPELWETPGRPTPASDVYALGATLYQAASLRRPFEGSHGEDLARRVRSERPRPLSERGLPGELSELVSRCLEKDPRERPTADEVADVLRRVLRDEQDETRTIARSASGGAPPAERVVLEDPPPLPPRRAVSVDVSSVPAKEVDDGTDGGEVAARRTTWNAVPALLTAAVLVAAVVGAGLWFTTRSSDRSAVSITDDELRAGVVPGLLTPEGHRTVTSSSEGGAVEVELDPIEGDAAALRWRPAPDEGGDQEYVVLVATFDIDPRTGEPSQQASSEGLLGTMGTVADADDPVLRVEADAAPVQVVARPEQVTCVTVVLVRAAEGIPSEDRPCVPTSAPDAPSELVLHATAEPDVSILRWADNSADESAFRVLGLRDQNGREEVAWSTKVGRDLTEARVHAPPGTCFVVLAENAAAVLPEDPRGLVRPTGAGSSATAVCS